MNFKELNELLYSNGQEQILLGNQKFLGKIFKKEVETRKTKNGSTMIRYNFWVTDNLSSVLVSATTFDPTENILNQLDDFQEGDVIEFSGKAIRTGFTVNHDYNIEVVANKDLNLKRVDILKDDYNPEVSTNETQPRVEFLEKTKYSINDSISDFSEIINKNLALGRHTMAFTDFKNSHAFPEIQNYVEKYNDGKKDNEKIKPIYGVTLSTAPDLVKVVDNKTNLDFKNIENYVYYDLETTGLSPMYEDIIEIGAFKIVNGKKENFQVFVKPSKPIPEMITNLTGITNDMVKNGLDEKQAIQEFLKFVGNDKIVAGHNNLAFDNNFIKAKIAKYNLPNNFAKLPTLDTMQLSRSLFDTRSHTLESFAKRLGVHYDKEVAHRADYDAQVGLEALNKLLKNDLSFMSEKKKEDQEKKTELTNAINEFTNIAKFNDINKQYQKPILLTKQRFPSNTTIYLKDNAAVKDFNKIISLSLTDDSKIYNDQRIQEGHLFENPSVKNGNIVLTNGVLADDELFKTALTLPDEELAKVIDKYTFISLPPIESFSLDYAKEIFSLENMQDIYKRIIKICLAKKKMVTAVSNASYLEKSDATMFNALINSKMPGGLPHRLYKTYRTANGYEVQITKDIPTLNLKTTDELLKSFDFLKTDFKQDVIDNLVFKNSLKIADSFKMVTPLKRGLFTPKVKGVNEKTTKMVYDQAHKIYGPKLPEIIEKRIEKELKSIIGNGYAYIYWMSSNLVKDSNKNGYIVGSRGSVGSSFVATMMGISEVNPLPPHYLCPVCFHFELSNKASSGFDLPIKTCPNGCLNKDGSKVNMKGDGHNIPFETFLGFNGDKVPDIDLNFSGEYQAKAHDFLKLSVGVDKAFRAGTINTLANKNAFNKVIGYFKDINLISKNQDDPKPAYSAEAERLSEKLIGVKQTTGQHPGGIIVVPEEFDIYDFTPVGLPPKANSDEEFIDDTINNEIQKELEYDDDGNVIGEKEIKQTKFDWTATHYAFEHLHDNLLKFDILGHVGPTLLYHLKKLTGVDPETIPFNDAKIRSNVLNEFNPQCYGLPEFGTHLARQSIDETKPTTFAELVSLTGLLHGTDVWIDNIRDEVLQNHRALSDVPCCRDDILEQLTSKYKIPEDIAFKIMEDVRKGKGVKPEYEKIMLEHKVPEWYLNVCKKIAYMFPKAHAVAYTILAYKMAYFKHYYPEAFYSVWLSYKKNEFPYQIANQGLDGVENELERLVASNGMPLKTISVKEKNSIVTLEILREMMSKGIQLTPINLNYSDSKAFKPLDKAVMPPFTSLDGLGGKVAQAIFKAREEKLFTSLDDLINRTVDSNGKKKLTKAHIFTLFKYNILPSEWTEEFKEYLWNAYVDKASKLVITNQDGSQTKFSKTLLKEIFETKNQNLFLITLKDFISSALGFTKKTTEAEKQQTLEIFQPFAKFVKHTIEAKFGKENVFEKTKNKKISF